MARALGAGRVAAATILYSMMNLVSMGLSFTKLCFDLSSSEAFANFILLDKSVNSFRLFIAVYRQVHAQGADTFAVSCLIGLSINLCRTVIFLYTNHRSRASAWISGMAIFVTAGAFLLGAKIPANYAWHDTAVEAFLFLFVCLDAGLSLLSKINQQVGNENLVRDLLMLLAETLVAVCLFADYLVTHNPSDAEKVLHLAASFLPVLIGLGQIGLIAYKACTNGVFAWGEEPDAAMDNDGGVDVEAQVSAKDTHGVFAWQAETSAGAAADGGDVEQQVEEGGMQTCPFFTMEVEMAAGDTTTEAASDEGEGSS